MITILVAVLTALLLGIGASVLMTRASNRPAIWNIAVGGAVIAGLAVLLFVAVLVVEWIAFR